MSVSQTEIWVCQGWAVTQYEDRLHKSPSFSSVILTTKSVEQPGSGSAKIPWKPQSPPWLPQAWAPSWKIQSPSCLGPHDLDLDGVHLCTLLLTLHLPPFLPILQPSCANEVCVLRFSCCFSGQKMKRNDVKKRKEMVKWEKERKKVSVSFWQGFCCLLSFHGPWFY